MGISTEEKEHYLRETAIVLAREGFQTARTHTGRLRVLLDDTPLYELAESGVTYHSEDVNDPERIDAKDKVYGIARTTAEYMRQMEAAPFLKASGLEGGYRVLADFNGTVLAGHPTDHGVQFVTWDWDYGHTGVCHGHYFMENYEGAKQDFAVRSGLISKKQLFQEEQLIEIYRCCTDTLQCHTTRRRRFRMCGSRSRSACRTSWIASSSRTQNRSRNRQCNIKRYGPESSQEDSGLFLLWKGVHLCHAISCEIRRCRQWNS